MQQILVESDFIVAFTVSPSIHPSNSVIQFNSIHFFEESCIFCFVCSVTATHWIYSFQKVKREKRDPLSLWISTPHYCRWLVSSCQQMESKLAVNCPSFFRPPFSSQPMFTWTTSIQRRPVVTFYCFINKPAWRPQNQGGKNTSSCPTWTFANPIGSIQN